MLKNVLDKGYVRIANYDPNAELNIVNAARVSFLKESTELDDRDIGLLDFLQRESHFSPFRHSQVTFEIYAPLMVARQMFKYRIGSEHTSDTSELLGVPENHVQAVIDYLFNVNGDDTAFNDSNVARNESSRRYVTIEPEFYVPSEWRATPDNRKQGSKDSTLTEIQNAIWTEHYEQLISHGLELYYEAMSNGIAPEQARLFLPAYGLYIAWRWTASIATIQHFLQQRLNEHAQFEIRCYAQTIKDLLVEVYPNLFQK